MSNQAAETPPPTRGPKVSNQKLTEAIKGIDLQKALTCAELSQVCYRNDYRASTDHSLQQEQDMKDKLSGIYGYRAKVISGENQQCVVFYNEDEIIVAFEGSRALQVSHYNRNLLSWVFAWFEDAPKAIQDIAKEKGHIPDGAKEGAKIHWGFDNALNAPALNHKDKSIWRMVREEIRELHDKKPDRKLYLTGHSAGGALATIVAGRVVDEMPDIYIDGVYTYGQPKVGGKHFRTGLEYALGKGTETGTRIYRFEQYGDPMPALPPYHEDEYVPIGRWIPMNLEGELLEKEQFEDNQPTISQALPDSFAKVEGKFEENMEALAKVEGEVRQKKAWLDYVLPTDLVTVINPGVKRSFSSLRNLFRVSNYTVAHGIDHYAQALVSHVEKNDLLPKPDRIRPGSEFALYHAITLIDMLQHEAIYERRFSQGLQEAMYEALPKLSRIMNGWERLTNSPITGLIDPSEYATHYQENTQHKSWLRRVVLSKFWTEEVTFDEPMAPPLVTGRHKATDAVKHIRGVQRARRIERLAEVVKDIEAAITPEDVELMKKVEPMSSLSGLLKGCIRDAEELKALFDRGQTNAQASGL